MQPDILVKEQFKPMENNVSEYKVDNSTITNQNNQMNNQVVRQTQQQRTTYQPQQMQQNIVHNLYNQNYNQRQPMKQNVQYQSRQMYNGQVNSVNNNQQPQNVSPTGQVGN